MPFVCFTYRSFEKSQGQTLQMGAIYDLIRRGAEGIEKSLEDELELQLSFFPNIEVQRQD